MTSRLPSTSGVRRAIVVILALIYGTFLAFVVFWPSPIDKPVQGTLNRAIRELHERGMPNFIDYTFVEFSANVLLFVPVGLIFGLVISMRWWAVALLFGPALSALIEISQKLLLEDRYASVYDVVANSIGATLGVLAMVLLRLVVAARDDAVIARYEALGVGARGQ